MAMCVVPLLYGLVGCMCGKNCIYSMLRASSTMWLSSDSFSMTLDELMLSALVIRSYAMLIAAIVMRRVSSSPVKCCLYFISFSFIIRAACLYMVSWLWGTFIGYDTPSITRFIATILSSIMLSVGYSFGVIW
ncbi:MAG: phage holin family protein [Bacteroidaceae bacterium]|nr:phage holin family protein [Bacteroidaceae bacterium]